MTIMSDIRKSIRDDTMNKVQAELQEEKILQHKIALQKSREMKRLFEQQKLETFNKERRLALLKAKQKSSIKEYIEGNVKL